MFRADPPRVGVWGGTRSGKTTWAKAHARTLRRRLVLDYLDKWGDVCPVRVTSLRELMAALKQRWSADFAIRYVPSRGADPQAVLGALSELLFQVQAPYKDGADDRPLWLIVEEMADPAPLHMPATAPFGQLTRYGRHYGVGIIGISQRMAEVTGTFRGNCETNVFFRMDGARDLQAASDKVKPLGKAYAAELATLQNHHALLVSAGKVQRVKNS